MGKYQVTRHTLPTGYKGVLRSLAVTSPGSTRISIKETCLADRGLSSTRQRVDIPPLKSDAICLLAEGLGRDTPRIIDTKAELAEAKYEAPR